MTLLYDEVMPQTRIEKAQTAYRAKNIQQLEANHTPQAITHSLDEPHSAFSLSHVILGGQDGLVNVLGVILGVVAASGNARIIVAAGLAAAFAESVSMGAVAYTSTRADAEHRESEHKRESWEIEKNPQGERAEIREIYRRRGFSGKLLEDVVIQLTKNKEVWVEVMLTEELKLSPVAKNAAGKSAVIVGLSAIIGSLIPLAPFFFFPVATSTIIALILSALTLFGVGAYKASVTVGTWYRSGFELAIIGLVSALVGYGIGLIFRSPVVP